MDRQALEASIGQTVSRNVAWKRMLVDLADHSTLYVIVSVKRASSQFNMYRMASRWLAKAEIGSGIISVRPLRADVGDLQEACACFEIDSDSDTSSSPSRSPSKVVTKRTWADIAAEEELEEELRVTRQRLDKFLVEEISVDKFCQRFMPGRIIARAGNGCNADVFLGRFAMVDVALKRLAFDADTFQELKEELELQHEARSAHVLPHMGLYIVCDGDEKLWAVTVSLFCNRGSLWDARLPLPAEGCSYVLKAVSEALRDIHSRGIVHNDIKPGNVLLDSEGHIFVHDFGLSVRGCSHPKFGGTPGYQCPDDTHTTFASDIFALGITIVELFVGHRPALSGGIVRLPTRMPRPMFRIISSMLSTDAGQRASISDILCSTFVGMAPTSPPAQLFA